MKCHFLAAETYALQYVFLLIYASTLKQLNHHTYYAVQISN